MGSKLSVFVFVSGFDYGSQRSAGDGSLNGNEARGSAGRELGSKKRTTGDVWGLKTPANRRFLAAVV